MHLRTLITLGLALAVAGDVLAQEKDKKNAEDELFTGPVPVLRIEIPAEGMEVLRQYHQVWRQKRPERIDVKVRVRQGEKVWSDVGLHLKGSYSYQPIDGKPSMTLNFDKFVPGQRFHGLSKIHLNNSVQDATGICEQMARELFHEAGIRAPRATPALVHLNGRDLGLCVLVEGANKSFLKRAFGKGADAGNLYDGGSGGDVTKELDQLAGEEPAGRADLKALADAAREPDLSKRLARLEEVLDVDHFITFAAIESLIVHWDGYAIGCNNYRVFNDPKRGKMVFIPHGLDQLFGTSNSPDLSLTPMFKGTVAKSLLAVPEARARYFKKIEELSTTSFRVEALHARADKLAERLRPALGVMGGLEFGYAVRSLKLRIVQRAASVARQLANPPKPMQLAGDGTVALKGLGWRFKNDSSSTAQGTREMIGARHVLRVTDGGGSGTGGSWRTTVLLDAGRYELTGLARTRGVVAEEGAVLGVALRISGETSTEGFGVSNEWKAFSYAFDVAGVENVEVVLEFRGPGGFGEFDLGSLKLVRKGAALGEGKRAVGRGVVEER